MTNLSTVWNLIPTFNAGELAVLQQDLGIHSEMIDAIEELGTNKLSSPVLPQTTESKKRCIVAMVGLIGAALIAATIAVGILCPAFLAIPVAAYFIFDLVCLSKMKKRVSEPFFFLSYIQQLREKEPPKFLPVSDSTALIQVTSNFWRANGPQLQQKLAQISPDPSHSCKNSLNLRTLSNKIAEGIMMAQYV